MKLRRSYPRWTRRVQRWAANGPGTLPLYTRGLLGLLSATSLINGPDLFNTPGSLGPVG